MTHEAKTGDVFLIPVSDSLVGIGQVVDMLHSELYLVVYEETWDSANPPIAGDVARCHPLFSSLSLDAKLWNGDWRIIGNTTENLKKIAKPMYKVRMSGRMYVESYRGEGRRLATTDEAERLQNRTTVSAAVLEKALRAKLGFAEWHPARPARCFSSVPARNSAR